MSAFVCNDETIQGIVHTLSRYAWGNETNSDISKALIPDYDLTSHKERERLLADLHGLNVSAVNYRYSHRNIDAEPTSPQFAVIEYKTKHLTPHELFKAIQCWLYQCMQGDFPEKPLFKAMQAVLANLATFIIMRSQEYRNANTWN